MSQGSGFTVHMGDLCWPHSLQGRVVISRLYHSHLVCLVVIANDPDALPKAGVQTIQQVSCGLRGHCEAVQGVMAQAQDFGVRSEGVVPLQQILCCAAKH